MTRNQAMGWASLAFALVVFHRTGYVPMLVLAGFWPIYLWVAYPAARSAS